MGVIDAFLQNAFYYTVDGPVTLVRDFVEKQQNRNPYYYYHRRYRRVTPIEDCNQGDAVCIYEAEMQYRRDKLIDQQIIIKMQALVGECSVREGPNAQVACRPILEEYDIAAHNFDTKYGGLGGVGNVQRCMMKQKHRLLDERKKAKESDA